MGSTSSIFDPTGENVPPHEIQRIIASTPVRWWLVGGAALDHWLGRKIRPRAVTDISTLPAGLVPLVDSLEGGYSAWATLDDGTLIPFEEVSHPQALDRVLIRNTSNELWAMQVHVEDGNDETWQYRRDGRLQLPWERAVLDIDGIPTGAPEVQLVWKALRPRPEDDVDKDAVVAKLSDDARAWYERAILSIHPHSSWSIHVRSPFAPGKASWNRKKG